MWLGSLVHGPEIGGIEVVRKVTQALNVSELSGMVLAVPICNPFGYYAPSTRTPEDGQNINRTFPGTGTGLLSNRVAHVLSSQLLPHADYVIDVHSNIRPSLLHTIVKGGSSDVVERSEAMADAMGVTKIWTESNIEDETGSAVVRTSGLSLTEWTTSQGKPSFVVELADQRRIDAASVDATVTGVRNVLKHLGMIEGQAERPAYNPVHSGRHIRRTLTADMGGYVEVVVPPGERVGANEVLANIRNPWGDVVQAVTAPVASMPIAYPLSDNQTVTTGDYVTFIAYPAV